MCGGAWMLAEGRDGDHGNGACWTWTHLLAKTSARAGVCFCKRQSVSGGTGISLVLLAALLGGSTGISLVWPLRLTAWLVADDRTVL